jgi:hypothetical protein
MPQLIGTHPTTEMPVYRELIEFTASKTSIVTSYFQWQELPNGTIMPESMKKKRYIIKDIPATIDEEGNVINPGSSKMTQWLNHIPAEGKTMEKIFEDAITNTLNLLPIDFPDGGVI